MPNKLIHPFLIDTLPEAERLAFVHGFEMGMFWSLLKTEAAFETMVHSENEDRLLVMLSRERRSYTKVSVVEGEWLSFSVEGK